MKLKFDKFSWVLIVFAVILIMAYLWIPISHMGVDYSQCDGKSCMTDADLFGAGFIILALPIFLILVVIKAIILIVRKLRKKN